jgi:hypothetical protein
LNRNTDKIYTSVAYEIPTTKPSQPLYERILNISFVVALGKVYILDKVLDLDTFLKSLSSSVPSYECDIIAYTIYYAQNDEDSKLANQIKFIIEKDKQLLKYPLMLKLVYISWSKSRKRDYKGNYNTCNRCFCLS